MSERASVQLTGYQPPGEIRLACMECDRDDFDGIRSMPEGWEGIGEAVAESSDWWTHLGWCPDCLEDLNIGTNNE